MNRLAQRGIFVSASHQIGLDTRLNDQKVGLDCPREEEIFNDESFYCFKDGEFLKEIDK